MASKAEARFERLESVAGEAARWLASPAARGTVSERRARVSEVFEALNGDGAGERGPGERGQGERGQGAEKPAVRVAPLEAGPVDDGSPLATFLTLTGPEGEFGALVLYGVHTALVTAQAGLPGCRIARLDPATGDFVVTEEAHRMPASGAVELLGERTVGAALYRVLLAGGAVVGPGVGPEVRAVDPRPTRDRAAALLLEAAGGAWISPSAFGSPHVLSSALPGFRLPPTTEPLFGSRGLFRLPSA